MESLGSLQCCCHVMEQSRERDFRRGCTALEKLSIAHNELSDLGGALAALSQLQARRTLPHPSRIPLPVCLSDDLVTSPPVPRHRARSGVSTLCHSRVWAVPETPTSRSDQFGCRLVTITAFKRGWSWQLVGSLARLGETN